MLKDQRRLEIRNLKHSTAVFRGETTADASESNLVARFTENTATTGDMEDNKELLFESTYFRPRDFISVFSTMGRMTNNRKRRRKISENQIGSFSFKNLLFKIVD